MNGSNADSVLNIASDLLHAPLTTGSGEILGQVEDMLINRFSGKITFLVVSSPVGEPGAEQGGVSVRLAWKDVKVNAGGDRLMLVPGRTPAKRLLLRSAGLARKQALH